MDGVEVTSPTNHEGGTEPRRRVSDDVLHKWCAEMPSPRFRTHTDACLLDLVDARLTIAALRERAETVEWERDGARHEVALLRHLLDDLRDRDRDREHRGDQVTVRMIIAFAKAWHVAFGIQATSYGIVFLNNASKALKAALAARPTGPPRDPLPPDNTMRRDAPCDGVAITVGEQADAKRQPVAVRGVTQAQIDAAEPIINAGATCWIVSKSVIARALEVAASLHTRGPAEARIAEAVAAERETCARLVETWVPQHELNIAIARNIGRNMAAAIRAPRDEGSGAA